MHRTSDSRRYREGDSFESQGEFEARGGQAYSSGSSSADNRALRWRDIGVGGSGTMLSWRRVTARRAIILGVFGAFGFACLPRRHKEERALPPPAVEHDLAQRVDKLFMPRNVPEKDAP